MLIGDEIVVTDNVDVVLELITLSHIAPELFWSGVDTAIQIAATVIFWFNQ